MKLIAALLSLASIALLQVSCAADASARHGSHSHGAGVSATDRGPGVSGSAKVY